MHNPYKYVPTVREICVNPRRAPSPSPWRLWLGRWLPALAPKAAVPPRAEAPRRGGDHPAKDQRLRRSARRPEFEPTRPMPRARDQGFAPDRKSVV